VVSGGEEFRNKLVARVGDAIEGKKRSSYFGSEGFRRYDEKEAERMIKAGLKFLGVKDEVRALAKNDPRKQALAWMVRTQTVASNEWVSERLGMGHPSNVSRALARFQMGKGKEIQRLKVILAKCTDPGHTEPTPAKLLALWASVPAPGSSPDGIALSVGPTLRAAPAFTWSSTTTAS